MTIPLIHCHTQIDKNTIGFAKFMWETMVALASRPADLRLTAHCMGPAAADRVRAWLQNGDTVIVPDKKGEPLNGSYGHAACIMSALAQTGNGEIHIVCDSDTVVIAKGWDDYIRTRLVNDNVGMIGTTYEELGGFSSGNDRVQTYKKSPTFTWAALNPMHNWRNLNVMPNKAHRIAIDSVLKSEIYGLPQGYSVFGEAAYQVPQYLYENGLSSEPWRQLKPSKEGVVLKGLSDYHEEYHAADVPFIVHHRGSMKHAYRSDRISKSFYGAVDAYLEIERPREPRWVWNDIGKVITSIAPIEPVHVMPTSPSPQSAPPFKASGKEWLKVTHNGTVIQPRRTVERSLPVSPLSFVRSPGGISHIRVEGSLEHRYPLILPPTDSEQYMVTVRNMTGADLQVTCGRGMHVDLPNGKTWWLLVDIDSVQRVE